MTQSPVRATIAAAIASTALAACSATDTSERNAASETPPESVEVGAPPVANSDSNEARTRRQNATIGGDGSPIRLSSLGREDIEAANLSGELSCSFGDEDDRTLLLANGNVASEEPAFGVVKVGDSVETVSTPGGFDAMLDGATFAGRGKTIEVERTSSEPVGGGESPPYPARLTYQRADGASRSFDGLWTCGP